MACAAALGCTPEFVAPAEQPGEPIALPSIPTLEVGVSHVRADVDSIGVFAYLSVPGDQLTLNVEDDTLIVDGVRLVPDPEQSEPARVLVYTGQWARASAEPTVTVRAPRVRGADDSGELIVPLVSRTGPAELAAVAGSDLLLPFVRGQLGTGLQVIFAGSSQFTVVLNGVVRFHANLPGEVTSPWRIPGEWLSARPDDTLQVRFTSDAVFANRDLHDAPPPPANAYVIRVRSQSVNRWTVVFGVSHPQSFDPGASSRIDLRNR